MTRQSREHLLGNETAVCDTLTVATCNYTFVQTHRI